MRCAVTVVAGYIATSGLVVWGARGANALGIPVGEALLLATMLRFVVYVGVVIWSFSDHSLLCVAGILGVGTVVALV